MGGTSKTTEYGGIKPPTWGASDKSDRAGHEQQAVSADTVAIPSAGDEFCSEGYAMCSEPILDWSGEPLTDSWRLAGEDDYPDGYGWLHIRVHEVVETKNSGVLAVYYRQWFAPDGTPAWGKRPRRTIGSIGSLKALLRRRKMTAQAIEARRAETGTGSVHESAVAESDARTPPNNEASNEG